MTWWLDLEIDWRDPTLASIWDEAPVWTQRFGQLIFDHLEFKPSERVLDLGCGTGFPMFELAHRMGPGCWFAGADTWPEALARAESKRRFYALDRVAFTAADGAHLPFIDGAFDLVVSNLGVNNFGDADEALRECARVTRAGGRLAVTTNVVGHMTEVYRALEDTLLALDMPAAIEAVRKHEEHRATRPRLETQIEAAGYRVADAHEDSFVWRFADGTALFTHWFIRLGFLPGWREAIDPQDRASVFAALEKNLNERSRAAGDLRLTIPMLYLEAERV